MDFSHFRLPDELKRTYRASRGCSSIVWKAHSSPNPHTHALILAPSLEKLTHLNPVMFLSRPIGRVFRLPFLSVFEYIVHSRNFSSVGLPELDTSP